MTSIVIPNSVTSIRSWSFECCDELISVTCDDTNPPAIGNNVFDSTNNYPIFVPFGSGNAYKVAENWSKYASRIQAIQ